LNPRIGDYSLKLEEVVKKAKRDGEAMTAVTVSNEMVQ
jgi:hypothetical protein